ncbi:methylamine utilization protein [Sphingomonas sp. RRHST34]|uniref:Methylamine utilization protein n=1 Tax=Sphingomonas citri TaxID=2862499 RepID=A0ABS7BL73_9SPHN|nr:methylamine utilization protein [Sphingomonas citri]MBW6530355.1 methylamine utilization protein [Sphingomonas citri]
MSRFALIACASACTAAQAQAATVSVHVVDAGGQPVSDAVVTIRPPAGPPTQPIRFAWRMAMVQKDITFNPHVLIVPVGATVAFPNQDKVRHHVYSFSKPARFELKLFGRDETRSYTFTRPGAVALGCNIHDTMSGFIKVVDTPFAGKTDAAGNVSIPSVTAGAATLTVWHPRLKAKDNEASFALPVSAIGDVSRQLRLSLR